MTGNHRFQWYFGSWLVFLCGFANVAITQSNLRIQLVTNEEHPFFGAIEIQGIDKILLEELSQTTYDSQNYCKIYTDQPDAEQLPMLGKLFVKDNFLYFKPRFPFMEGRTYWVATNFREKPVLTPISIPQRTIKTPPKVVGIYPSSSQWHANQLKFYISFDQPMRYGEAYQYVQMVDEAGKPIETPFLEMAQELWNARQTRLTIWFDPGRIKQLLIPNQQKGTPLNEGRKYQLIIRKEWMAANGLAFQEDYRKDFEVLPADHTQPNPQDWQIKTPASGSKDAFIIQFPESMDYALLLSGIGILNAQGELITGRIETANEEKNWHFYPTAPWESGDYNIRVSNDVEDLAGNNLGRLFDSEYQKNKEKSEKSFVDLPVRIR